MKKRKPKSRLPTIEEHVYYHPLLPDEIAFANKLSTTAKQTAISVMNTEPAIGLVKIINEMINNAESIEKSSKYNEMLLDEFDMDEIVQSCPSQDAPEEINVIPRIPVEKFLEGNPKYRILLELLDSFALFRSKVYQAAGTNAKITKKENWEGRHVELEVEDFIIDDEVMRGVSGNFKFVIKVKHKRFCDNPSEYLPNAIKLKFIIDIMYNDNVVCHVTFFGDKSMHGIQPYVRISSLHFTAEKNYTFSRNKEYVFLNLDNIITIYNFANKDITTFISLILNLISTVFNISSNAKGYQNSTMSKHFKKFIEGLCMKVITDQSKLKGSRIDTIKERVRMEKKRVRMEKKRRVRMEKERVRMEKERGSMEKESGSMESHKMEMGGAGRNRKIKSSKSSKKPTTKSVKKPDKPINPVKKPDKPINPVKKPVKKSDKKSDKPVKKSDKPVKKSDKPVKKSDKPVKKPVKKSDKPVKKSDKPVKKSDKSVKKTVKKTTKKARDGV